MFARVQIFADFCQLRKLGIFKLVNNFDVWKEKRV